MAFKLRRKTPFEGSGLILFARVEDAIKAERALKGANYVVKLVAPPPGLRKGCDLAVEINLVEQMGIERLLTQRGAVYTEVAPLKGGMEPLDIVKITHFGDAIMVKAANMKLTFDKNTGVILNTSGGGCPDIPYLHNELIDKKLTEAPRPKELGYTLCALMLDRAFMESLKIYMKTGVRDQRPGISLR
ncbi:MAG: DUF3343 domain-containing protein [Deltaproteobacteria bacterium]|nr:DUF3343 domain-containing protein [Deltaproteobacteria bacterium]